jgi:hypothetical protein
MIDTYPTFLRMPITAELVIAVANEEIPEERTTAGWILQQSEGVGWLPWKIVVSFLKPLKHLFPGIQMNFNEFHYHYLQQGYNSSVCFTLLHKKSYEICFSFKKDYSSFIHSIFVAGGKYMRQCQVVRYPQSAVAGPRCQPTVASRFANLERHSLTFVGTLSNIY